MRLNSSCFYNWTAGIIWARFNQRCTLSVYFLTCFDTIFIHYNHNDLWPLIFPIQVCALPRPHPAWCLCARHPCHQWCSVRPMVATCPRHHTTTTARHPICQSTIRLRIPRVWAPWHRRILRRPRRRDRKFRKCQRRPEVRPNKDRKHRKRLIIRRRRICSDRGGSV